MLPSGICSSSSERQRRPSSSSSSSPIRRQRVSRRLIVRARAARKKLTRDTPRDGGASQSHVVDPSDSDKAFTTMAAGTAGTSPRTMCSHTARMSNTVRIFDSSGQRNVVGSKAMQALSEFGEIARVDTSIAGTLGTVLVTYFDVRCAQFMMRHAASRVEPVPPASHDCRTVAVDLSSYYTRAGCTGGFQDFGEVAHVDVFAEQVVVEFYDLRSAQALLAAAGDCATPALGAIPVLATDQTRELRGSVLAHLRAPPGLARPAAAPDSPCRKGRGGMPGVASEQAGAAPAPHRGAQSTIAKRRFQKFDVNPDAILKGEERRTSVMVRGLQGRKFAHVEWQRGNPMSWQNVLKTQREFFELPVELVKKNLYVD
ncbi:unnamed protein product [Prorocentrum cordatum]|uniref:RRM domain-containing protein n=1 Tax=Prorocentrum cordatum TaxID=2364126 RepID=A0ABN9T2L2_9DINO|nr:unnamed protein product [Polarella glacialis]